jgi:hypothetical protein
VLLLAVETDSVSWPNAVLNDPVLAFNAFEPIAVFSAPVAFA